MMAVLTSLGAAGLEVIGLALDLVLWALILGALLSWLAALGVLNANNRVVATLGQALFRLTEPLLRPVRRRLPTMGPVDLAPLVVIFAILFLQAFLRHLGASL